jgi:hypothetical protein
VGRWDSSLFDLEVTADDGGAEAKAQKHKSVQQKYLFGFG